MRYIYYRFIFFLIVLLSCNISFASIYQDKYHDYRAKYLNIELQKMQEFHLQQAQIKLKNGQSEYAWGDLAYLLCHVPNHHEALQKMQNIASQLNKNDEMTKFFEKAIKIFPDDDLVRAMYNDFKTKS